MKLTTSDGLGSRSAIFAELEALVRGHAQAFIQSVLEDEVDELLSRAKSERREEGSAAGYRNGYGEERRLSTSIGTVKVRRPRVRGTYEQYVSRMLPLFTRSTSQVSDLLPQLYLHGLASGDFELAMRGLLGDGAPLSPSSIMRLKASWQAEYEAWNQRALSDAHVVYAWVDGIYVKAGLEKDKAALLVMIGALSDGSKRVLAVACGHRESEEGWSGLLRSLKARGMNAPRIVVGDGNLGIWSALNNVFPDSEQQRCWLHRMRNILDCVGKKKQAQAKEMLTKVMYASSQEGCQDAKIIFQKWARDQGYNKAADALDRDWERMVAYYSLPKEHWVHLRTTNIIESPFASVRLRTAASKRYKKVEGATAMIWKLLMVAEMTFRKLRSAELLIGVAAGALYKDGVPITSNDVPQDYKIAA
jgi:transposase-like protein